ncbi:MAG TPA: histone deacetylase [Armatimonadota bacterium]|nr:histone deacetylase [Armatimonadota bacterium]
MPRAWCVYSHEYHVDMGEHVFPVEKYRLIHAALTAEGVLAPGDIVEPVPASEDDLLLVHDAAHLAHMRRLAEKGWGYLTPDTPISPEILEKSILSAGGSILAARIALELGGSLHLSGGFHHAFADHGEGFCYINDVAVAIRRMQADGLVSKASVIDCDLHQGNGTAAIFRGDAGVFTFSIHEEDNYPGVKPPSDLDIGLPYRCADAQYIESLRHGVNAAVDGHSPELVIYLAGADPYEDDVLGSLAVTMQGLRRRDQIVIDSCARAGVPLAIVLAGGYARRAEDTVAIHCQTAREMKRRLGRDETQ